MKMIAALQARSDTVRGAPPRAREGGGGSSGLDTLPMPGRQELIGQGGHERDHPKPSVLALAIAGPTARPP
jgi:hypothetical protein